MRRRHLANTLEVNTQHAHRSHAVFALDFFRFTHQILNVDRLRKARAMYPLRRRQTSATSNGSKRWSLAARRVEGNGRRLPWLSPRPVRRREGVSTKMMRRSAMVIGLTWCRTPHENIHNENSKNGLQWCERRGLEPGIRALATPGDNHYTTLAGTLRILQGFKRLSAENDERLGRLYRYVLHARKRSPPPPSPRATSSSMTTGGSRGTTKPSPPRTAVLKPPDTTGGRRLR